MEPRRGTMVAVALLSLAAACTSTSPSAPSADVSEAPDTTAPLEPVTAAPTTTTTVTPEPQPAAVRGVLSNLQSLSCETLWPGHRARGYLEFSGRDVTNTAGSTQVGMLTKHAETTLQHHVGAIDFETVPTEFEGTTPTERETVFSRLLRTETSCELEVLTEGKLRVYRWTEWPHEDLEALIEFLGDEVWPLGLCKSTTSMQVKMPCNYQGID